jgi:hypothetical protein
VERNQPKYLGRWPATKADMPPESCGYLGPGVREGAGRREKREGERMEKNTVGFKVVCFGGKPWDKGPSAGAFSMNSKLVRVPVLDRHC